MTAIALTIAGSDSGGGAGIQADLKTFSALGVYGASVITALTAQNTKRVSGVHGVPPEFVTAQMDAVFPDLAINAVKIGMLHSAPVIEAVAAGLRAHQAQNIVLDPVMVATSGDPLIHADAITSLRQQLFPLACIITPNLDEAALLLGLDKAANIAAMQDQAERLISLGARAVLLKGGHLSGNRAVDLLHDGQQITRLTAPYINTLNTHGTGCTLASALAAGLAQGLSLAEAADRAKQYLSAAIAHADTLSIGHGAGPVHHFHHMWSC